MSEPKIKRPCDEFIPPPDGLYGGYCERCGYSTTAHKMWDQWTREAEASEAH